MVDEGGPVLGETSPEPNGGAMVEYDGQRFTLRHGAVTIAAITSCTNTSNPDVMIGAGLVARKARERGLTRKPWVKTSLAPGSKVVTDYLNDSGLMDDLEAAGFYLVGYGCTTCIGNSGPLPEEISTAIHEHDLVVASVLSGNRNFEGRISPDVRANYLASPPLVVAYALAGTVDIDLTTEPIGKDGDGKDVYLREIWPTPGGDRRDRRPVCQDVPVHRRNTATCSRAPTSGAPFRRPASPCTHGTRRAPTCRSRRSSWTSAPMWSRSARSPGRGVC